LGSTSKVLQFICPITEIHGCFERVNQLLSLLVPVSDINRAALGVMRRNAPITFNNGLRLYPDRERSQQRFREYLPNFPNHANGEV